MCGTRGTRSSPRGRRTGGRRERYRRGTAAACRLVRRSGVGAGSAVHRRPARPRRGRRLPRPDRLQAPPASPTASSTTGPAPGSSSRRVRGATGSGTQRLYGFRDILVLKVVKRLLDTGVSLQQIRVAISHLRERGVEDLAQITLMSDGASVYECTSADEVIDLVQGGQGVFGIAVGRVWREVEGEPGRAAGRARRDEAPADAPRRRAGDPPAYPRHRLTPPPGSTRLPPVDALIMQSALIMHVGSGRRARHRTGSAQAHHMLACSRPPWRRRPPPHEHQNSAKRRHPTACRRVLTHLRQSAEDDRRRAHDPRGLHDQRGWAAGRGRRRVGRVRRPRPRGRPRTPNRWRAGGAAAATPPSAPGRGARRTLPPARSPQGPANGAPACWRPAPAAVRCAQGWSG